MQKTPRRPIHGKARALVTSALLLSLAACNTHSNAPEPLFSGPTPAELAAAAAAERTMSVRNAFADCRAEGLLMLSHASEQANNGQYQRAGLIFADCLDEPGVTTEVAAEDRLRVLALATLSQLKAGDLGSARELHARLESEFTSQDLYFADGTSFTESLDMLLGDTNDSDAAVFSTANVGAALKSEMRRVRYWQDR